jgi:hypothetical protein
MAMPDTEVLEPGLGAEVMSDGGRVDVTDVAPAGVPPVSVAAATTPPTTRSARIAASTEERILCRLMNVLVETLRILKASRGRFHAVRHCEGRGSL